MIELFNDIPSSFVLVVSAILATVGWIYTARRARWIARKQHTLNTLTTVQFYESYRKAFNGIPVYLRNNDRTRLDNPENEAVRRKVRLILNHFEFISAGIRRGDLDEALVYDAYRGTIRVYFESFEDYIYSVRNTRKRNAVFEHIEWLYVRWEKEPPGMIQQSFEAIKGGPFYGQRARLRG